MIVDKSLNLHLFQETGHVQIYIQIVNYYWKLNWKDSKVEKICHWLNRILYIQPEYKNPPGMHKMSNRLENGGAHKFHIFYKPLILFHD